MDSPKYASLAGSLRSKIAALPVGASVSSERQLAEESGVSRMTARRAIDELVREGMLVREVGRGTFVARPAVTVPLQLTSFSDDMRARGHVPSSRVLQQERVSADARLADIFGVDIGEPMVVLRRLRFADEIPLAIERTHLRESSVPRLLEHDFSTESLYQVLVDDFGIRFEAGEQVIRAGLLNDVDAQALQLTAGDPVLELVRTSVFGGEVVEWTTSTYPASRFELSARIAPSTGSGSAVGALRIAPFGQAPT
ncbi:GntR family transcriptional regulator [Microbacterium murale]|uniref:GntR family transcriptional regulator n=1 Tax=Microbacterium murale TaxID=1081040 RepID=A0ABU0PCD5_9MICO|nr:GntR family transcriptional regulator [Microbacterium murale]MDQ0644336.1 GntR family transcriptional regulator [Microbacterium murale]